MRVFSQFYRNSNTFGNFEPLAEGGWCFLQFPGDSVYLPPGTMHTITTISGGCLTGITWVSNTSLIASVQIFIQDAKMLVEDIIGDFGVIVQSIHCVLRLLPSAASLGDLHNALQMLCNANLRKEQWDILGKRSTCIDLIKEIEDEIESRGLRHTTSCIRCRASLVEHLRGSNSQPVRPRRQRRG